MQNLNLWRKAEEKPSNSENKIKFKNVKRSDNQQQQKVLKKKVPVFKKPKSITQKKSKKKPEIVEKVNAEDELK
jgi:hypothetical protein